MSERPLSKHEEERLLNAATRVLCAGGFPNPERAGCPDAEILKSIALRKVRLRAAEPWIDHIGSCSPCFIQYNCFREQLAARKRVERAALTFAAVAAMLIVAVWLMPGILFWRSPDGTSGHQAAYVQYSIDLRNWSIPRGGEEPRAPIELPRRRLAVSILLPVGSDPGSYEVQVLRKREPPLLSTRGEARVRNHDTVLDVRLDLTALPPGPYLLGIRPVGWDWAYHSVLIQSP